MNCTPVGNDQLGAYAFVHGAIHQMWDVSGAEATKRSGMAVKLAKGAGTHPLPRLHPVCVELSSQTTSDSHVQRPLFRSTQAQVDAAIRLWAPRHQQQG